MAETPANERADWDFATIELLEKQGIDLKEEMKRAMEKELRAIEEQFKKEKLEADAQFERQRKVIKANERKQKKT